MVGGMMPFAVASWGFGHNKSGEDDAEVCECIVSQFDAGMQVTEIGIAIVVRYWCGQLEAE